MNITKRQRLVLGCVFFALMFLGVQMALLHYARTVAIAAAQEGARAAAVRSSRDNDGITAAAAFVNEASTKGVLDNAKGSATRTATTVTVTITGFGLSVIPGWHPHISQSATVTIERLTTP